MTAGPIKPIFLFSLPRSGSTLLQKLLMTHQEIAAVTEPWILLPFIGAHRKEGTLTDYSHLTSFRAVEDFIENLGGEESYLESLGNFILELYGKAAIKNEKGSANYFLDKTPRYYLIIPQILRLFPHAKFIFLFRNPLSIYTSVMQTWHKNRLKFHFNHIDLYEGPHCLARGYELIKDRSIKLNYENLVQDPLGTLQQVADFLHIPLSGFDTGDYKAQELHGTMGDPEGINRYRDVSAHSIERWKQACNSLFRKKVLTSYINGLSPEFLAQTGFESKDLQAQIKSIRTLRPGFIDMLDYSLTLMYRKVRLFFQILGNRHFLKTRKKRKVVFY